eukprot:7377606-Prymnesium_polylepis.2
MRIRREARVCVFTPPTVGTVSTHLWTRACLSVPPRAPRCFVEVNKHVCALRFLVYNGQSTTRLLFAGVCVLARTDRACSSVLVRAAACPPLFCRSEQTRGHKGGFWGL